MKPTQKSIPTKHGLQSLGKVPTARKAPANLPSLKAEHSGNDPTINLVPAGHNSAGGWTAGKEENGEPPKTNNSKPVNSISSAAGTNDQRVALVKNSSSSSVSAVSVSASTSSVAASSAAASAAASAASVASTVAAAAAGSSPPTSGNYPPSSLSSKTTWGQATSKKPKPFVSQRSPHFGQEFPSLTGNTESPAPAVVVETGSASPPPGNKADPKYGPGPSLRPQSIATWSKQTQQQQQQQQLLQASTNSVGLGGQDKDNLVDNKGNNVGPAGSPSGPMAAAYEPRNRNRADASGGLKFDVGVNSELLKQGGAPFIGRKHSSSQRGQLVNKNSAAARARENLFQGTIIDSEKLKLMDNIDKLIDSNDDDWTRKDEAFDYNKKIDR